RLLRSRAEPLHQPAGTAAMGGDGAVCDPRLRVRGIDGLSIADLSVLPAAGLGGVATAAMIGERCATFLRGR
ncbi:GMC family oxidoreductase, partial [Klebsiella pneumoniae]|nr:GMC family oxidoreductase [Klebsiella pneumoniae]